MIVSMGVKEIQPFMKCRRIFYFASKLGTTSLVLSPTSVPLTCSAISSASLAYIGSFLLAILFPDDKW
jgi:hypothetical protein